MATVPIYSQVFVILVVVVPLILVATNRLRLDMAGILTALSLGLAQTLGLDVLGRQHTPETALLAFSGLSAPVTITLFSLFVVTRALDRTGAVRLFARRIVALGGASPPRQMALLSAISGLFSLFMNNIAAGALVLPAAMEISRRTGMRASRLLIPVAYGSCLGGAATYFTSNNIIASDILRNFQPGGEALGIFDFAPVGLPIFFVGILYFYFFGERVLPEHEPTEQQQMARLTGSELEQMYALGGDLCRLSSGTARLGGSLGSLKLGEQFGITVVAVRRGGRSIFSPAPEMQLREDDCLIVLDREQRRESLAARGYRVSAGDADRSLSGEGARFYEIVPIPQSRAEGQTLRELRFRTRYGLNALALRREGKSLCADIADIRLRQGDSILAIGGDERLKLLQGGGDFILLAADPGDQPTNWRAAGMLLGIYGGAVLAAALGFPIHLAMLAAACLILLGGVISMEDVYRGMEWQAIVLIAGMYPLSIALVNTGLAEILGSWVVAAVSPAGPLGLVAGAYLLTALLSQIVAGQVTTLLTVPILVSAAVSLNIPPAPVAIASAVACSASFLTPISHPVNSLMIGPGNYSFNDFFRAGWRLTILSFVVLLAATRLYWGI